MMVTSEQIIEQALRLPEEECFVIANSLLESVEDQPPDRRSDEEWLAEVERRSRAALAGGPTVTWEEARARIEKRLGPQ